MSSIIYKATNNFNSKVYIGKTSKNIDIRKRQHKNEANKGVNFLFYKAIRKYGFDNFTWDILLYCEDSWANYYEKNIIKIYNSNNRNFGYNSTIGGDGAFGYKHSEERKMKISIANKGKKRSLEVCKQISETRKGTISPRKGCILSEETKLKISQSKTGKKGHVPWNKGKKNIFSEEALAKISNHSKGSNNPMFGKPSPNIGIKLSEETKLKMSIAKKEWWDNKKNGK